MALVLFGDLGHKHSPDGILEHLMQSFLRQCRTFNVGICLQFLRQLHALLASNRRQVLLLELLNRIWIIS